MSYSFSVRNLDELSTVAAQIWKLLIDNRVNLVLFDGEMGAGKTTLIRSMCEFAGVQDTVTSPTFSIVNEYAIPENDRLIYHFDFYRIKSVNEVYDIGYEEYFYSGDICLLEWASQIKPILDKCSDSLVLSEIQIRVLENGTRNIVFTIN